MPNAYVPSALTLTYDSHLARDVRISWHGPNRQCHPRQPKIASDCSPSLAIAGPARWKVSSELVIICSSLPSACRSGQRRAKRDAAAPARGALATKIWRARRRWALARQDAQTRQGPALGQDRRESAGADLLRTAWRGHPLDRSRDGQGVRHLASRRPAPVGRASSPAASPAHVQTLQRSDGRFEALSTSSRVGLYMDPPAHAVVVSIDEKSQIQALDRTQPGLPLKPWANAEP